MTNFIPAHMVDRRGNADLQSPYGMMPRLQTGEKALTDLRFYYQASIMFAGFSDRGASLGASFTHEFQIYRKRRWWRLRFHDEHILSVDKQHQADYICRCLHSWETGGI